MNQFAYLNVCENIKVFEEQKNNVKQLLVQLTGHLEFPAGSIADSGNKYLA